MLFIREVTENCATGRIIITYYLKSTVQVVYHNSDTLLLGTTVKKI